MCKGPYSLQYLGERDGAGRGRYEMTAVIDGVRHSNKMWVHPSYVEQMHIMTDEMNTVYQTAFEYGKRVGKLEALKEYKNHLEESNQKLRELIPKQKKYVVGNVNIDGTSLKGYLHAKYSDIVTLLGSPMEGDGYKVQAEWNIKFDDGTVVAIYDWKMGDTDVNDITEWHIGGHNVKALERLGELFGPEKVIMR